MDAAFLAQLEAQTEELHESGLFKQERTIASPQQAVITLEDGSEVINMCANNYLGLADHPALIAAASAAMINIGASPNRTYGVAPDRAANVVRKVVS